MNVVTLKKGKEKQIKTRHPWIFSGAISGVSGNPNPGDTITVVDSDGNFLALGQFCPPGSSIALRLMEWRDNVPVDDLWINEKIDSAIKLREKLSPNTTTTNLTRRLVHSESDFLPGVIVDQYSDVLVIQLSTHGADKQRDVIIHALKSKLQPSCIYERSDGDGRKWEGLPPQRGVVYGKLPEGDLTIMQGDVKFNISIVDGQKTGFYLDQKENRIEVAKLAANAQVLDCFSYCGGFTIPALAAGASHVTSVDSSANALALLEKNLKLNNLDSSRQQSIKADVFEYLRENYKTEKRYDMIILDPPKLAPDRGSRDKAMRAYKDINLQGLRSLRPGGILATFSCSGSISSEDFRMATAWASIDAGKEIQIIKQLHQAGDHPIRISFPESEYLKGLLVRAV